MTTIPESPTTSSQAPGASAFASAQGTAASAVAERPELAVGAAFAGGLLVALILKRLAP